MKRLRRWQRSCLVVLILLAFLCLGLCVALGFLVGRSEAQEASPPLDVMLLIDHSDSMWDKGGVGSDPDLLRVRAARLLMAYLGAGEAPADHRLGVIHFGGGSELVAPLTPLDSAGQRAIRAAIADPQRMGWTDPLEALNLARETLFPQGQCDPARKPVIILITDGKPELASLSSDQERAAYLAELRSLADRFREQSCPIFTIALSNEAIAPDPAIETLYRNLWQEIAALTPPASYHEAEGAADLLPACHAIVARLSGAATDAPLIEAMVSERMTETVEVEAGLARLTLVVLHDDPAMTMDLWRPGGAPARPSDPDVQHAAEPEAGLSIWAVKDPRPGRWTLSLRGRGAALAWRDVVPQRRARAETYHIEVAEPPARPPGDRPIIINASLRKGGEGESITDSTLRIVGEVRRAGFVEAEHLARDDGEGCDVASNDGLHCLALSDAPPGACTLLLRALLDGEEVARRELAFEVEPSPSPTPSPEPSPIPAPSPAIAPPSQQHAARRETWPFLLIGLIALGSLGGGGWLLLQRQKRPKLSGRLRVLAAPSGERAGRVIDLPACHSTTVGPAGKRSIPLPGATAPLELRAVRGPEEELETWIAPLGEWDEGALKLNDRPLQMARRLRDGDVLKLGAYRLRYEDLRQASLRRARHRPRRRVPTR